MYPFLMRVQGTLRKLDSNVALMFSRYLYLEAKKIIDKHGWNSTTKMTNKTSEIVIRTDGVKRSPLYSACCRDGFFFLAVLIIVHGVIQMLFQNTRRT